MVGYIKVEHPSKVETGHNWTTWDVKQENYIGSMVGVSGIALGYVTCRNMTAVWMVANYQYRLKNK